MILGDKSEIEIYVLKNRTNNKRSDPSYTN